MFKYALCISGSIRSFPRSIFIDSIKIILNEIPNIDIFIVLKITDTIKNLLNSPEGINSLIQHFKYLKPKKLIFVESFLEKNINLSSYSSQLLLINKSIEIACKYDNYNYFIRFRPDFILLNLNLDIKNLNDDTIYTTRKSDAKASDQVFMFSSKLRKIWWNNINFFLTKKKSPEYVIFKNLSKHITLKNGPCFYGGLLRNEATHLCFWDKNSKINYKDKYNLKISEDIKFEKKYKSLLFKLLKSNNIDFEYINRLEVNT